MRPNTCLKLLILFISLVVFHCNEPVGPEIPDYQPYTEIIDSFPYNFSINIKIDKKIELLNVIQHLSNSAVVTQATYYTRYANNVERHFSDFKNHPAVVYIDSIWNNNLSHDSQPAVLLYHSDLPEMSQLIPYSDYLISRAGSVAVIERMVSLLRKFYYETDFESFWNDHVYFYTKMENEIKIALSDINYINILENFYGENKNSYTIIPAPLSKHGYGPQVIENDLENIYNICGAPGRSGNEPDYSNVEYLRSLVFHEFSHSFVNPVTEKYNVEIVQSQKLFDPIRTEMRNMNYGTWQTCVNEHLVRLNVSVIYGQLEGEEKRDSILTDEYNKGFIYINELNYAIQDYIENRTTHPTYEEFYPAFIDVFNRIARE